MSHRSKAGLQRAAAKPRRRRPSTNRSPFFKREVKAQAKLRMGKTGDRFEREADSMADRVVERRNIGQLSQGVTKLRHGDLEMRRKEDDAQAREDDLQQAADEAQLEATVEEAPAGSDGDDTQRKADKVRQAAEDLQTKERDEAQARGDTTSPAVEEPAQAKDLDAAQAQSEPSAESLQNAAAENQGDTQLEAAAEEAQASADEAPESVQRRTTAAAGWPNRPAPTDPQPRIAARRGMGAPLPDSVRQSMEQYFAADFSGVRIHTDEPAVQLSRELGAQAFTQGRDIFFGKGKFNPATRKGEHLLAHELTHTLQQGAADKTDAPSMPAGVQRKDDDTMELRPELLEAIRLARGEIGKVNAKELGADGTRRGWQRLHTYFNTAFGGKDVVSVDVIRRIVKVQGTTGTKDAMPSWCGIFVWWALKTAGLPIRDWKLGATVLDQMKPRAPGELPQKGDIAYRAKNQHFALVLGVEDAASRAGKSFRSIRVATINGNTSGDDNLGGQVEEKWDPISRWLGFFDPVAKLDLPDVELVSTSLTPDEPQAETLPSEGAGAGEESTADDGAEAPPEPTQVAEPVAEPTLETPSPADAEIPVPPLPAPAPPEVVAPVEPVKLEGPSDQAMVSFTEAAPSAMAAAQPQLAPTLDRKVRSEKQAEADQAPVLQAATSGEVNAGLTSAGDFETPPDATLTEGGTGPEGPELQADDHKNKGPAPTNVQNERTLDDQDRRGSLIEWLRQNMAAFLSRIRTSDPNLSTHAGKRPKIALSGKADPGQANKQRQEAQSTLVAQRDAATQQLKKHPGQTNIQPKEVDEKRKAAPSPEVEGKVELGADSGMADYVAAPLPEDVRTKADELLGAKVQKSVAKAREKTQSAAQARDADKKREVDTAKSEAQRISKDADQEQRGIVIRNRQAVAKQQQDGITEAYENVNEFSREAATRHKSTNKDIRDKVKTEEGKARRELESGEKKANEKKTEGERKAKAKKAELKKKQKKKSWWSRVKGAIKSAVKAITKAIDKVMNAVRKAVKFIIEKAKKLAVALINKARKWVIEKLNQFRDWAKKQVNKYLKDRFPGLAKRINKAIDATVDTAIDGVNKVADAAIRGVEALANALAAALDKILSAFQTALKAAVGIAGAVLTGDFAEALRIAIQSACDIAGIDSKRVFGFLDRAKAQIVAILKNPVRFFKNLATAVGNGIRNFLKNIKKHLITGLIGWLTGALSAVPITMPKTLDLRGVVSLGLQILGLTYANIKARVIRKFPAAEKVFSAIEKGVEIIRRVRTEGPVALWKMVKERLANFREMVVGAIRNYVITKVATEAVTFVLSMLNPAGAIVKVVQLIYRFATFLIERWTQIKDFVSSVWDTLTAVASGNFTKVTQGVEGALARSLPVFISLVAKLAGLGGIGKAVQKILRRVSRPVNKVIDKVVDKVVAFARKLLKKGKSAAKKVGKKLKSWWKQLFKFRGDDGKPHRLFFRGSEKSATLMVASQTQSYDKLLDFIEDTEDLKGKKKAALAAAKPIAAKIKSLRNKPNTPAKTTAINKQLKLLAAETKVLFGTAAPPPAQWTFGPIRNLFGTKMVARPLTSDLSKMGLGSPPTSAKHAHFNVINERRDPGGNSSFYIKGHLLNEQLGGPGQWHNMTPLTRSGNAEHETKAESVVKAGVEQNAMFDYKVIPKDPRPKKAKTLVNKIVAVEKTRGTFPTKAAQKTARIAKLTEVVKAENLVPQVLNIEITRITKKGSGFKNVKRKRLKIDNTIDRTPSSYYVA